MGKTIGGRLERDRPTSPRKEEVTVECRELDTARDLMKAEGHLSGFQEHSTKAGKKSCVEYSL